MNFLSKPYLIFLFFMITHSNPISNIFSTPSQKQKYKLLGVHTPEGNWAIGNLNPLSLT